MDVRSTSELVGAWDQAMWTQVLGDPFSHPATVMAKRSVLLAPAPEMTIRAAETRLGVKLPPSYRAFLARSNGAYAGASGPQQRQGPDDQRPLALLPVESIDFSTRWCFQWPVDGLLAEGSMPRSHGDDRLFAAGPRGRAAELADLSANLEGRHPEFRLGHLCYTITIGLGDDDILVLNPQVTDGRGEWEVRLVSAEGSGLFFPSFESWLENQVDKITAVDRLASELWTAAADPDTTIAIEALKALIRSHGDPDRIQAGLEAIIINGRVDHPARRHAAALMRSLDLEYGGDRFPQWVVRIINDPAMDDIEVLSLVGHLDDDGPVRVQRVAAHGRRADLANLGDLSTSTMVDLYQHAPDPVLGDFLAQRGHPSVVDGALAEMLAMTRDVDHWLPNGPFPDRPDPMVTHSPEALLTAAGAAGESYQLIRAFNVGLALARAGFAEEAVAFLYANRGGLEGFYLLYPIAEIDIPRSWEILDEAAQDHRHGVNPINTAALLASARTRSPLLAPRARQILDADEDIGPLALLALEMQRTESAGDMLLELWREGRFGALRALARRGDTRITDDCLQLLGDPDPELQQVGAETLRDLRDRRTVPALLDGVARSLDDRLIAVQAHALVAMGMTSAAPTLRRVADRTSNPELGRVLEAWATQLDDRPLRGLDDFGRSGL